MLKQYSMSIPVVEPNGQFETFQRWVDTATRMIGGENALCVDTKDRICAMGADFMRARDEGTFPIRYYFNAGSETPARQRKSAHLANLILHGRVGARLRRNLV